MPGEHVGHGMVAALERALKLVDILGGEMRGLVERHAAVGLLGEEAVEDYDVEVEVWVDT